MTTPTLSSQARDYLTAVERELADLSVEERTDLLEDLALHLTAVEEEHDERTLSLRLGDPAAYAAELRTAAGLPSRTVRRRRPSLRRITDIALVQEARAFVPQLAPGWWVLRGYLVVLLASLQHVSGSRDFPIPTPAGSRALGVGLVLLAVAASVAIGRRGGPLAARVLVIAVDVVIVALAFQVAATAPERLALHSVRLVDRTDESLRLSPLATRHGQVTNLFVYAADGTPLTDVLLYDQDGRPLLSGRQLWWPDHCRRLLVPPTDLTGAPVANAYPQHYVLDPAHLTLSGAPAAPNQCTPTVARPKLTPAIVTPKATAR